MTTVTNIFSKPTKDTFNTQTSNGNTLSNIQPSLIFNQLDYMVQLLNDIQSNESPNLKLLYHQINICKQFENSSPEQDKQRIKDTNCDLNKAFNDLLLKQQYMPLSIEIINCINLILNNLYNQNPTTEEINLLQKYVETYETTKLSNKFKYDDDEFNILKKIWIAFKNIQEIRLTKQNIYRLLEISVITPQQNKTLYENTQTIIKIISELDHLTQHRGFINQTFKDIVNKEKEDLKAIKNLLKINNKHPLSTNTPEFHLKLQEEIQKEKQEIKNLTDKIISIQKDKDSQKPEEIAQLKKNLHEKIFDIIKKEDQEYKITKTEIFDLFTKALKKQENGETIDSDLTTLSEKLKTDYIPKIDDNEIHYSKKESKKFTDTLIIFEKINFLLKTKKEINSLKEKPALDTQEQQKLDIKMIKLKQLLDYFQTAIDNNILSNSTFLKIIENTKNEFNL